MLPDQNVRVVLLNQFDLVLTTELAQIYQVINRYLIDGGVLPDLKGDRKTTRAVLLLRPQRGLCNAGQQ